MGLCEDPNENEWEREDSQRELDKGVCFFQSLIASAFDNWPVRETVDAIDFLPGTGNKQKKKLKMGFAEGMEAQG